MSYFLVGYNILEQDVKRALSMKSGVNKYKYEYFRFDSVKVLDSKDFSVYDLSLDEINQEEYAIIGTHIPVYNELSVNIMGEMMTKNKVIDRGYREEKVNSPLYCSGKLVFPTSNLINKFIEYKNFEIKLKINLITFDVYLEVYGFPILGSDTGEFEGVGLVGHNKMTCSLSAFNSLIEKYDSVDYVGDTLAVCDLDYKKNDYILKNGIKKAVVIMPISGKFNLVLPPTIEHISILNMFNIDNLYIAVPKAKFNNIVNDLALGFEDLKDNEKLDAIADYGITLNVY